LSVEAKKNTGSESVVYRHKNKFGLVNEHKVPINIIIGRLLNATNINETFQILNSFKTAYVTKEENDRLNDKYKTSMPN